MGAAPQMVDWNQDGKKDLISGDSNGYINLFINNGTNASPNLAAGTKIKVGGADIDVGSRSIPCVNDWNEDGKKDLLCGREDGRISLFINTGTNSNPSFSSEQFIQATGGDLDVGSTSYDRSAPRVIDLDRDGKKDLVIGDKDGSVWFYSNSGTNASPKFTTGQKLQSGSGDLYVGGSCARIDMVDWDEDGDVDLLAGNSPANVVLFKNEGKVYAVDLEPEYQQDTQAPGGSKTYTISVKNDGSHTDTITITRGSPPSGWTATLSHTSVTLASGASTNITLTVKSPSSATTGSSATIKVTGTCSDGVHKDEVTTKTIVQVTNMADLWLEKAYLVKPDADSDVSNDIVVTTPTLGQEVRLICKVQNLGTLDANSWKIQGFMDGTKVAEGTFSLGAGKTTYIWRNAPWTATGGSHALEWKVDTDNVISELDETNNSDKYSFTVPGVGIADLCMDRAYLVQPDGDYDASNDVEITSPTVGQDVRLICKVSNNGTADANTWQIQGLIDGTLLAQDDFNLPAGMTFIIWRSSPWSATAGSHTLTWKADTRNDIVESNETNNEKKYSFSVGTAVAECPNPSMPETIQLSQNYPNPFNPKTMIHFAIPKGTSIRLSVYNTSGQLETVLMEGFCAEGWHEVEWSASNVASGIYYAMLEANGEIWKIKMCVVK